MIRHLVTVVTRRVWFHVKIKIDILDLWTVSLVFCGMRRWMFSWKREFPDRSCNWVYSVFGFIRFPLPESRRAFAGFLPTSETSSTAPASAWWTRTCGSSSGWSSTRPTPSRRRRSCWRLWPAQTTSFSSTGTNLKIKADLVCIKAVQ